MSEVEHNEKIESQLQQQRTLRRMLEASQERDYFKRLWEAEVEVNDGKRGKEIEILLAGVLVGCVGCVVGWLIWRGW